VAVDSAGNVYVTDTGNRVLTLAAGSSAPTVLPFTGLDHPVGETMTTAAMATYAYDQIDQARTELEHPG
jgi:serine/threonine-protein kinase